MCSCKRRAYRKKRPGDGGRLQTRTCDGDMSERASRCTCTHTCSHPLFRVASVMMAREEAREPVTSMWIGALFLAVVFALEERWRKGGSQQGPNTQGGRGDSPHRQLHYSFVIVDVAVPSPPKSAFYIRGIIRSYSLGVRTSTVSICCCIIHMYLA